ncbi:hypothetical protein AAKU55_004087 [Oxalobacteraceae bacterium GrIS 1.11]
MLNLEFFPALVAGIAMAVRFYLLGAARSRNRDIEL